MSHLFVFYSCLTNVYRQKSARVEQRNFADLASQFYEVAMVRRHELGIKPQHQMTRLQADLEIVRQCCKVWLNPMQSKFYALAFFDVIMFFTAFSRSLNSPRTGTGRLAGWRMTWLPSPATWARRWSRSCIRTATFTQTRFLLVLLIASFSLCTVRFHFFQFMFLLCPWKKWLPDFLTSWLKQCIF